MPLEPVWKISHVEQLLRQVPVEEANEIGLLGVDVRVSIPRILPECLQVPVQITSFEVPAARYKIPNDIVDSRTMLVDAFL